MIQKSVIFLMLSCTGGASFFLGGTEIADSFPFLNFEVQQVPKVKNIAKPKSFYSNRETFKESAGTQHEPLSFFTVLNDPSLVKMVGLNGEIIKKYDSSPAPVMRAPSKKKIQPKISTPVAPVVPVKTEKIKLNIPAPVIISPKPQKAEVKVRQRPSNPVRKLLNGFPVLNELPTIPAHGSTGSNATRVVSQPVISAGADPSSSKIVSYVVQVSSFRQLQRAEEQRGALGKKGYASFIGKTELPDNKGTWYRVYIGRYFNHAGAEMAAERFYREENRKAMVIRQTG